VIHKAAPKFFSFRFADQPPTTDGVPTAGLLSKGMIICMQ